MARSRRGLRTRLDAGERERLSRLKKAGYRPRGAVTPRKLKRKERERGMAEVAAGRARAYKVGRAEIGKWQAIGAPTKAGRVILPARPGQRVTVSHGKIRAVDLRTGEKIRIDPILPGRVPEALRQARPGEVVTVETASGYILPGAHSSPAAAYRHIEQSPRMRATRAALVVAYRTRSYYQRVFEEQRRKYLAERERRAAREQTRRAALRRSIRPFR